MHNVVQYVERYKKNIALDMRKRGFSYSEIQSKIKIPRSTLSFWLKSIRLSPSQLQRLSTKRSEIARANAEKRILKTAHAIEAIQRTSSKSIQEISKRELWLMGIALYWRREKNSDLRKGVRFSSSDPNLIKLFLKWLTEIGQLDRDEIAFDIFVENRGEIERVVDYWTNVTGFPNSCFTHIYYQGVHHSKGRDKGRDKGRSGLGILRIRVKASSMLARQISGWIKGIQKFI